MLGGVEIFVCRADEGLIFSNFAGVDFIFIRGAGYRAGNFFRDEKPIFSRANVIDGKLYAVANAHRIFI